MATNLGHLIERAALVRRQGNWAAARQLYESAAARAPAQAEIRHNLALCLHALGLHSKALEHSEAATRRAPALAAAWVLRAKIERALDETESAEASLRSVLSAQPLQAQARLELARLMLADLCDAREAQRLIAPLLHHPQHARDAQLTALMAKLYDREESAEEYTRQLVACSEHHLKLTGFRFSAQHVRRAPRSRRRAGLLSPLFCASPVYFLTIGGLSLLREEVDFVVLNRGTRNDWATDRFRALASEWHDLAHLSAEALANAIYAQNLDALFELGGWMDPIALKALSAKPAPRMYKWVGGQSCTTGMKVFDGFLSDAQQTPADLAHLYTEPLVLLDRGYVSYTPPPGIRKAKPPQKSAGAYGVISNPVKISRAFLDSLPELLRKLSSPPVCIRFVDRRYRHENLRRRLLAALRGLACPIEFIAPVCQHDYIDELSRLDCVIDTFPYNGGLTTLEALHSGARCVTRPGSLFCERHSLSHVHFSGSAIARPVGAAAAHKAVGDALLALIRGDSPVADHGQKH